MGLCERDLRGKSLGCNWLSAADVCGNDVIRNEFGSALLLVVGATKPNVKAEVELISMHSSKRK